MRRSPRAALVVLALNSALVPAGAARGATKYERLHRYCVTTSQHAKPQYQTNLGPTGAMGWVYMNRIYIEAVEKGSPADGLLKKGDYLLGVNGKRFPDIDPRVMLGEAITRAEAGDGVLRLRVANKQKERSVTVRIEPIGRYAATWPFDCRKSAGIRDRALAWLRNHQRDDGTFGLSVYTSFNGLFLLSSPRPEDQEAARRCAYGRLDGPPSDCYNAWSYGYSAMFLAEYYLATGDAVVLPRIELYAKEIAEGQTRSGSWCHGMVRFGVPGGYGELNQAGIMCFMSLVLAKECGVAVDEEALGKARRFFGRFAGLGHIPYGNHPPWTKTPASNGKNAIAAVAFNILGDREKVRAFADSTTCGPEYLEAAHTGCFWGVAWNPLGMIHSDRASFHSFQKVQLWYYDLGRRWDGGLKYLPNPENLTGFTGFAGPPEVVTGAYGLVFALPWKSLRILGRGRGPFNRRADASLRDGVALFKQNKWDAFDAWMSKRQRRRAASYVKREIAALAAAREAVKGQIAWTLAAVGEKAAKGALPRTEIVRAKSMLGAVDRLAGTELDAARRLRARLDAVREIPDGRPGKRGRNLKWRPLLPLANQMKKSDRPKIWRAYAWTKEISPALDNLEPAGAAARGWYLPGFNDTKWLEKKAPFRVHKGHRMELKPHPVGHHAEMYQPRPLYNSYARTRFNVDDARTVKAIRVVIQNGHQYLRSELYLNGYRVAAILRPNSCELSPEAVKLLKPTRNCLAVYLSSHRGHLHDFDFGLEVSR